MSVVRVLTVYDQPVFRAAARALIASTPGFECAGEADSGPEGIAAAVRLEPDLESVAADWAHLDAYLVSPEQSHVAPIGHRKLGSFFSERMDTDAAIFHPVYFNDYSSFALKEGEER